MKTKHTQNKTNKPSLNTNKQNTNMSDTPTQETAKKSGGKLPESIYLKSASTPEGYVQRESTTVVAMFVKMNNVKEVAGKSPEDVVKAVLLLNLRAQDGEEIELPASLAEVENFVDDKDRSLQTNLRSLALQHKKIKKDIEKQKSDEKILKDKEKLEKAKAKADEDKRLQEAFEDFSSTVVGQVEKTNAKAGKVGQQLIDALSKTLPSKVSMTSNGMGLAIADGATSGDIAAAVGSLLTLSEGVQSAQTAMQFGIGDLMNAAINNKVFRNQGDAAAGMRLIIQDRCQKNYATGTLAQNALLAERIKPSQRKPGIPFTLYLHAAKVTPPRLKGSRPEDEAKAEEEVQAFRDAIVEEINTGSINTTQVAEKIKAFKIEKGFIKPEGDKSQDLKHLNTIFMVEFITSTLKNTQDKVTVARGKETHEYTLADLAAIKEEAYEALKASMIEEKYDIDALIRGSKTVEKGGKSKLVPYYIADPFFVKEKESEEPKQIEGITEVQTTEPEDKPEISADNDDNPLGE